jgi:hypothetical protein
MTSTKTVAVLKQYVLTEIWFIIIVIIIIIIYFRALLVARLYGIVGGMTEELEMIWKKCSGINRGAIPAFTCKG